MSRVLKKQLMNGHAVFDAAGIYRYRLTREWDLARPRVVFIMLNPSTADATRDDPTIRRCIGFARAWGYGSLEVLNLFAYRTPHPRRLAAARDPVGPENDEYLVRAARRGDPVLAAWGIAGRLLGRDDDVVRLLARRVALSCLGMTRRGCPRHPLYVPAAVRPTPWMPEDVFRARRSP